MTFRARERSCERAFVALTAALPLLAVAIFAPVAAAEPPAVGGHAPDFSFQGSDGKTYSLQGLLAGGKQGIVLAFFPKAFTPG